MTTQKQVIANRSNAQRSAGPRSVLGKEVVSQNAIKHGLLSKNALLESEDHEDFDRFRAGVYNTLLPEGKIEEFLCDRIVSAS